jgi:hypothetical protein
MKNILNIEDFSNEPKLNEASVQIAGRQKPSGAKVLATVIVDRLEDQNFLKLDNVRLKNLVISDLTDLIMDSTF